MICCHACGILPLKRLSGTLLLYERTVISLTLSLHCTNTNRQPCRCPRRPPAPPQPAPLPPCTSQIWLQGQSTGLCGGGGSKWPRPQQCGVELRVYKAAFLLSGPHKRDIWESGGSLNMQTSVVLLVLLAVASHTVASKCKTETCCF